MVIFPNEVSKCCLKPPSVKFCNKSIIKLLVVKQIILTFEVFKLKGAKIINQQYICLF